MHFKNNQRNRSINLNKKNVDAKKRVAAETWIPADARVGLSAAVRSFDGVEKQTFETLGAADLLDATGPGCLFDEALCAFYAQSHKVWQQPAELFEGCTWETRTWANQVTQKSLWGKRRDLCRTKREKKPSTEHAVFLTTWLRHTDVLWSPKHRTF